MSRLLEVIVTSVEEAKEAEQGGADRLELVRAFEVGGLTPAPKLVEQVVAAVSIPVRVMLRENASMSAWNEREVGGLQACASQLAQLPVDGFVLGFVKDGSLDVQAMDRVLAGVGNSRATLHRAFEHASDSMEALQQVKRFSQIDRILTSGGEGAWPQRKARLIQLQTAAAPDIRILVGVGLCTATITEMSQSSEPFEFHVGRAARLPQTTSGVVSSQQIAKLKALL